MHILHMHVKFKIGSAAMHVFYCDIHLHIKKQQPNPFKMITDMLKNSDTILCIDLDLGVNHIDFLTIR